MRSVLAVLVGFGVMALTVGFMTPAVKRWFGMENFQSFSMGLLFATLGYMIVAAVAGGYLTGVIAGRRELPHAAMLGMLMIGSSFVSMRIHNEAQPGWYETTVAGCGPIAALFGAGLSRLRKR